MPIKVGGIAMTVGASIGISVCPIASNLERELLTSADAAMYHAKRAGRNQSALHPVNSPDAQLAQTPV